MKRAEAMEALGLSKVRCDLTETIIREAFSKQVALGHPDSPDYQADNHIHDMDKIKDARDFLLKNLSGDADFACKLCNGLGMVRAKIGWLKCSACKGTGEKR